MKARTLWIAIAVVFVGLVAFRIAQYRKANAATQEKPAEAALIRAARASRADLSERVALTGTVRPKNEVDVFAKVPGRVESLHVEVGDRVKAGALLATIEHKEIGWQAKSAQAASAVAQANLQGAKLEHDRVMALFKGGAAPQSQVDGANVRLALAEAQAAQAEAAAGLASQQLENARVEAPIAGTVIRRPVNVGAQVGPQAPIATLQDMATLKLESSVDAATFVRLEKGREAIVSVDAFPGEHFQGKVTILSPSLDATSRRAAVELEIDNGSGRLLPNMFAHADVSVGQLHQALVIPRQAVYETAGGARVFRIHDGKVQELRPKLGPSDGDRVAVLEGLSENDEVAVSGLASLSDGAAVKIAADGAAQAMNEGAR